MPGEGLFDDSSSEDEEQVSQPTPSKGPPNKRVIREDAIDDNDSSDDDDDDNAKEKSQTDESKSDQPQKKDNPDGNKMDVDDDVDDEDKKKSSSPEEEDEDVDKNQNKSEAAALKPKPTMGGLFDDSDDDDDDNVFDDKGEVVGSSAPEGAVKKPKPSSSSERLDGVDDDEGSVGLGGNDGDIRYNDEGMQRNRRGHQPEAIRSQEVHKPPSKATALDVDRPGTGETMHMMKIPNLLAVQPACFDEDEYDPAEEEEQYKGYVHNMMRWRYKRDGQGELVRDSDGKLVRESNTKLVKWSDGSYTLHIGNEAFNIHSNDATTPDGFAGLNGYVYLSHKAVFTDEKDGEDGDGDAPEEKTNLVLDCVGPVASRFVPKPSSLQSEAHKSLMVAVRSRTIKKARIATMVTEEDPEQAKQARVRSKEDAEKQQARKRENYSRSTGGGGGGRRRGPGMNRSYLEGDDDEGYDTVNIRALKRGVNDEDAMNDYGDDSDDSDGVTFGTSRARKRQRAPAADEESDDDEGEMVFDDDDDEEEELNIHTKKKATPSKAMWDDDE